MGSWNFILVCWAFLTVPGVQLCLEVYPFCQNKSASIWDHYVWIDLAGHADKVRHLFSGVLV